ncbi:MAG: aminodeoxychorismate synthase component I [Fimbriimonadales bacterium]|nr:aminodeoxychorismate synthase component I [Fimbriimonadales bacterium]MDW8051703.1 aminodeoxychorismate synthase component I [Armatimonadota bacterium]
MKAFVRYHAPDGQCYWLAGVRPATIVSAQVPAEVLPAIAQVERACQQGLAAIGYVAYEAAHGLDKAFPYAEIPLPLVWFAVFEELHPIEPSVPCPTALLAWHPTVSQQAYLAAVERIKQYILAGDVYQVNYSFRLRATFEGDPVSLFWQLYHAQPVPYAAYIDTEQFAILSLSPELFFALDRERLISRPMKGTAPRGLWWEHDLQQATTLRHSEKNRAENLMIVDMVRNDLGRVARVGSVRVPALFETERYATVWQMTSTVEALTDASLAEIFRALFPGASVTGAPKIRATQIIHELETTPRGVYTGAVGIVLPNRHAQFNLAIRTLVYHKAHQQLEYGVGSGIVWDSEPLAEYAECLSKAQVLLSPRPEFELLETMLWHPDKGYFLLKKHLRRLARSAEYFGFRHNPEQVRAELQKMERLWKQEVAASSLRRALRVRLLLDRDGCIRIQYAPLDRRPHPWRVALAPEPVNPQMVFLYHKTTHRAMYERARAARPDCDEVILWNTRGEITEATTANVVVQLGGKLYTPPVACGLLNGVYREHLLESGRIDERVITVEDLLRAERLYLINSVRGWIAAKLAPELPRLKCQS